MNKKVVWDLFGGLNGSVGLAIGYEEYDIYTIDILPKTKDGRENIVINLATNNDEYLLNELEKLPKPDIIVASPMCQSFSMAATCVGGNASWVIEDGDMNIRTDHSVCKRNYNSERLQSNAFIGKNALLNTIKIIKHFTPKHWYIENPKNSLMWRYIELYLNDFEYIKNDTYYNCYGAPYKKPTRFLSNIELNLSKEDIKPLISFEYAKGGYDNRSDIPKGLLQDIFKEFNNE